MEDDEARNRRLRLRELIDSCFAGRQKSLIKHIEARTGKAPNQGELSGLAKIDSPSRSFGYDKAKILSEQIGLHRRWFEFPLGTNLLRDKWLDDMPSRDVNHVYNENGIKLSLSDDAKTLPEEAESPEHQRKGVTAMGAPEIIKLLPQDVDLDHRYIRMEMLSAAPSAGPGGYIPDMPYVVRHVDVLETWARSELGCVDPRRVKIMTCTGDSMEETIRDRDIVFVDLAQNRYSHDGIYVLSVGDRLLIKRLSMSVTGGLRIISDNKDKYEAEQVSAEDAHMVNVSGRVLGWWTLRKS